MRKAPTIILLVAFAIFMFVTSRFIDDPRHLKGGPSVWAIETFLRYAGGFIAVAAALGLLLAGVKGAKPPRLVPYSAAVLAGLLIMHPHWALAIALAIIVAVASLCGVWRNKQGGGSGREEQTGDS